MPRLSAMASNVGSIWSRQRKLGGPESPFIHGGKFKKNPLAVQAIVCHCS
jgi:hypothetical protein